MSATILLAEDELPLQELISTVLTEVGFSVLRACNGQEALEKLTEHADHLDALITDIKVGHGPTGWQIGRTARHLRPLLPIIYMSGDGSRDWPMLGVADSTFLAKPFRLRRLVDRVEAIIGEMSMTSQLAPRLCLTTVTGYSRLPEQGAAVTKSHQPHPPERMRPTTPSTSPGQRRCPAARW